MVLLWPRGRCSTPCSSPVTFEGVGKGFLICCGFISTDFAGDLGSVVFPSTGDRMLLISKKYYRQVWKLNMIMGITRNIVPLRFTAKNAKEVLDSPYLVLVISFAGSLKLTGPVVSIGQLCFGVDRQLKMSYPNNLV